MLNAAFSVRSLSRTQEGTTSSGDSDKAKKEPDREEGYDLQVVENIELCTLTPALIEEGPALHRALQLISRLSTLQGKDFTAPVGLRWSALTSLSAGGATSTSWAPLKTSSSIDITPDSMSFFTASAPPVRPFLCVHHCGYAERFSVEIENLLIFASSAALRWVLCTITEKLAALLSETGRDKSSALHRGDLMEVLQDFIFLDGAVPGGGAGTLTPVLMPLQVVAHAVMEDCTWCVSSSTSSQLFVLQRVRWSSTLVRALSVLLLMFQQHHHDEHRPWWSSSVWRMYCQGAISPNCFKNNWSVDGAHQEGNDEVMEVNVTRLIVLSQSMYLMREASDVAVQLFDVYVRPAERHRDDGTDYFSDALKNDEEKETNLQLAIEHYSNSAKLAQAGLLFPIRAGLIDEPSWRWEDITSTSANAQNELQLESRFTAPHRNSVAEGIEALWAAGVLPFPTARWEDTEGPTDIARDARKYCKSESEDILADWISSIHSPFRFPGASQSKRWASMISVSLDLDHPRSCVYFAGSFTDPKKNLLQCYSNRVIHDSIVHHVAVRPAVAALAWRATSSSVGQQPHSIWSSLLPPSTTLQHLQYSLVRLLIISTANIGQCLIQLYRLGHSNTTLRSALVPSLLEAARRCDQCLVLLHQHVLACHRPPESSLYPLLSPFGTLTATPFRLRLLLQSNPLPRGSCDDLEGNRTDSYKELLWCFQMHIKLRVRAQQLWAFGGDEKASVESKRLLMEEQRRWSLIREEYEKSACACESTNDVANGKRQKSATTSRMLFGNETPFCCSHPSSSFWGVSAVPLLTHWFVTRLLEEDWAKMQSDIRSYM